MSTITYKCSEYQLKKNVYFTINKYFCIYIVLLSGNIVKIFLFVHTICTVCICTSYMYNAYILYKGFRQYNEFKENIEVQNLKLKKRETKTN